MYWPTATAKRFHVSPGLGSKPPPSPYPPPPGTPPPPSSDTHGDADPLLRLCPSPSREQFATLSRSTLSIWSTRPTAQLTALVRTPKSIEQYGANQDVCWRHDGRAVAVQSTSSYLLLYLVHSTPKPHSYIPSSGSGARSAGGEQLAPSPASLRATFAAGAGERDAELRGGTDVESEVGGCEISFRLVLRIDAGLQCVQSTATHLLLSTLSPPSMQCIPWPLDDPAAPPPSAEESSPRTSLIGRLAWIVGGGEQTLEAAAESSAIEKEDQIFLTSTSYSSALDLHVWLTSDGRAYVAGVEFDTRTCIWRGRCFHGAPRRRRQSEAGRSFVSEADESVNDPRSPDEAAMAASDQGAEQQDDDGWGSNALPEHRRGTAIGVNAAFSLISVGQADGTVAVYTWTPASGRARPSHSLSLRVALRSTASHLTTGPVKALSWSDDGHALSVAWERGWGVWSTYGKLMGCSLTEGWENASRGFSDHFMRGVRDTFWGPGNTELFLLHVPREEDPELSPDQQLFSLPFAKSAVAGQHSPDNTRYAFIQLDDSVLVYRGSEQPDMSIINPESDVWHHIKIPQSYLASNWPIRYASISADGRLIAVAGRRGIAHFSSLSGRWKVFASRQQEQSFAVRGGLQWYQHVLVAACTSNDGANQLRLYSRDSELDDRNVLHVEKLDSPVVLTSLFDNSLLVYTADNTFYHYLIDTTADTIRLSLCGSITFDGVVAQPSRVRGMSWMIPPSQQRFGDPMDDLTVATVIFLIDGRLVLLRPRRAGDDLEELAYDMQILGDRIEYYWTHLSGIGTLENSLWGYDGTGIKLWLDALTIEHAERADDESDDETPEYKTIEESVSMPLDFYPLCVLIEKGIVIGVEPEVSLRRTLDFALFRSSTNTHLFLHHILRCHLERGQLNEAVYFASYYQTLVYFAHALEILLHAVLEDEADALLEHVEASASENGLQDPSLKRTFSGTGSIIINGSDGMTASASMESALSALANGDGINQKAILPLVVDFLDHFDEALQVVVGCARKTEVARWAYLFHHVGDARDLFERCVAAGQLKTAGSYLLVLHNLEPIETSTAQAVRLLKLAAEAENWSLCKDLLRFARSMDDSGSALRHAVREAKVLPEDMHSKPVLQQPTARKFSPRSAFATLAPPTPSPSLARSTSAPTVLDQSLAEEDESLAASPPHRGSQTGTATPQRATSLFGSSALEGPPIPQVSVNGRVLPPVSMPRRSSSGHTGALRGTSSGLGMSLSRVGLRSTDRVWDAGSPIGRRPGTEGYTANSSSPPL